MDTLELIDSAPRFEIVKSQKLFYGQYRYMARFRCQYLSCLRGISEDWDAYLELIQRHFAQRTRADRNYSKWPNHTYAASWASLKIPEEKFINYLANLQDLGKTIHGQLPDIKLMISGDYGYLYCNQPQALAVFAQKSYLDNLAFREVEPTGTVEGIVLQKSQYQYRTFFKNRYIDKSQKDRLISFLSNNSENIRLGPSLKRWSVDNVIEYRRQWVESYYFFDHTSTGDTTMLELMCPSLIRKTLPIVILNN